MNRLRKQLNEIIGLLCLSCGITPTEAMKEQLGIAQKEDAQTPPQEEPR